MAKQQAVRLQKTSVPREFDWRWLKSGVSFVGLVLMAAALGYGGRILLSTELFPVRKVRVEGVIEQYKQRSLEEKLHEVVGGSLFTVNLLEVKTVAERLPWVQSVEVSRSGFDVIRIDVTEQQIVARWGADRYVNAVGEVIAASSAASASRLPILVGPERSGAILLHKYRQFEAVVSEFGDRILRIEMSLENLVTLHTENGLTLRVGQEEPALRLRKFFEAYTAGLVEQKGGIEYVDLRYTDGFAVMWNS